MITLYDIEVPEELKRAHFYLLIVELLLILPGVLVVVSCGYVIFFRVPQFHVHVHVIMSSIFIAYSIVTITRLVLLVLYFSRPDIPFEITRRVPFTVVLDALRCTAGSAVLVSIPILTLERVVATLRIKQYEKERHRILLVSFLLLVNVGCCCNAYLIIEVGVPLTAFITFGMIWLVLNLLGFQRLVKWSQDEYELQMKMSVQPLTVRFQLSENVRLGTVLLVTLKSFCFGVATALIIIYLTILVTVPYGIAWATLLLYHLFELTLASATALVGLTLVNSDKKWKKEFRKTWACFIPFRKQHILPEKHTTSVFSLTGSQLVFRQDAEAATYFANLRSQWQ